MACFVLPTTFSAFPSPRDLPNPDIKLGSPSLQADSLPSEPPVQFSSVQSLSHVRGSKIIPKEKKCKKAKWLSEEALQIAVKRREAKSKGEKERYTHLNAEFQRIARRDKKAFLSNQCKEIEENNRTGKTRDLFKKIRDTKGTFMQRWAQ